MKGTKITYFPPIPHIFLFHFLKSSILQLLLSLLLLLPFLLLLLLIPHKNKKEEEKEEEERFAPKMEKDNLQFSLAAVKAIKAKKKEADGRTRILPWLCMCTIVL